ncbi:hypothetical protein IMZ48_13735 [Candidatus Bathyarchaeota archaeon]|nr:hypothetical protein [Candidatus Bathyarchaeota archaeon]
MRVLNLNFLSCAVKACKSTNKCFPLHPKGVELAQDDEVEYKPEILASILPRLDWEALRTTCREVSLQHAPPRIYPTWIFTPPCATLARRPLIPRTRPPRLTKL